MIYFKKGFYLYIGSAKRNLPQRILRHLSKNKKLFWHIDYLLMFSKIINIWVSKNLKECQTANYFFKEGFSYIPQFGSSDCWCKTHLFFKNRKTDLLNSIKKLGFKNLRMEV